MSVIDAQVMFVETVTVPEWMMNPSFHDYGERTFYDGDWYFVPDQDGYESGPYRYALLNLIRSVSCQQIAIVSTAEMYLDLSSVYWNWPFS